MIVKQTPDETFGGRLREAFDGAKNAEIARKLDITEPAVKNYMDGRVPPADTLVKISHLTNCSIHWLLTGEPPKYLRRAKAEEADDQFLSYFSERLRRRIAEEGCNFSTRGGKAKSVEVVSSILDKAFNRPAAEEVDVITRFEGEENTALSRLADKAGGSVSGEVHRIVSEYLRSHGLVSDKPRGAIVEYYGEMIQVKLRGEIAKGRPIRPAKRGQSVWAAKTWDDAVDVYALRARGGGLEEEQIKDGDLLICLNSKRPSDGQLVVAIVDSEEVAVKKYFRSNGQVKLVSKTNYPPPQVYEADRIRVEGIILSVQHQLI